MKFTSEFKMILNTFILCIIAFVLIKYEITIINNNGDYLNCLNLKPFIVITIVTNILIILLPYLYSKYLNLCGINIRKFTSYTIYAKILFFFVGLIYSKDIKLKCINEYREHNYIMFVIYTINIILMLCILRIFNMVCKIYKIYKCIIYSILKCHYNKIHNIKPDLYHVFMCKICSNFVSNKCAFMKCCHTQICFDCYNCINYSIETKYTRCPICYQQIK